MGRRKVASARRKSSGLLAVAIAPVAVMFALGADVHPLAAQTHVKPAVERLAPAADTSGSCCMQVVAATPAAFAATEHAGWVVSSPAVQSVSASRLRIIDIPQLLPAGDAPERGLQVKTILASRVISVVFPEIHDMGGVRPDALRWHPNGLALDVMIPNPSSAEGIALGNQIVAFALKNADRFGLQDAIWRGVYYTRNGPRGSIAGHYDHVHITTTGGGYPTGGEVYYR
ncbi:MULTISPECIES: hypothetical protein [unclassified Mycobacterium]|uniref:hypothetical protein n=1 Tax=unclassified Mycobacterium TaxID=2642494 RepID=UPI0029C96995|nr:MULTISPECIES: hypothetical protein [unclassified Mycobacterium]